MMIRRFRHCFLTLILHIASLHSITNAQSTSTTPSLEEFVNSPHMGAYVQSLRYYQQKHPLAFPPLELLRIDLISENDFVKQAQKYAQDWKNQQSKRATPQRDQDMLNLSREANESLESLFRKANIGSSAKLGSLKMLIDKLGESTRVALTPLDPMFKTSEVGNKIYKELSKLSGVELQGVFYDMKKYELRFDGKKDGRAQTILFVRAIQDSNNPSIVKVRTYIKTPTEALGPDLTFRSDYFSGTFLNTKDKSDLPFGKFPTASKRWMDESGNSHFEGDGHNHPH